MFTRSVINLLNCRKDRIFSVSVISLYFREVVMLKKYNISCIKKQMWSWQTQVKRKTERYLVSAASPCGYFCPYCAVISH